MRSNHGKCSIKKNVIKNFAKFFFNEVADLAQLFSCEF